MRNYLFCKGILSLVLLFSQSFLAPLWGQAPPNDNCEDVTPTVLTNGIPVSFTGTTVGGSANPGEPRALVWEVVTLTGTRNTLTVSFCGTTPGNMTRTYPYYYKDCPPTERFSADSNDKTTCSDENVTYRFNNLPAGTYYLPVIVDAGNNTLGEYTMNVLSEDSPAPALANDNCVDVTPTVLTSGTPVTFTGTTVGATASGNEMNYFGAAAVWEAVTLTECSSLTVDFCGTPEGNMSEVLSQLYKSCSFAGSQYANIDTTICSDGNATYTFKYLPAGTYYLPVAASEEFGNTLGEYTMNVLATACPPPPPNDNCEDVTPTALVSGTPVTFTGTTEMQTSTPEEQNLFGRGVVWEAVTLTGQLNNLKISYCGTPGNNFLPIVAYTTSCPATAAVQPHRIDYNACGDGNQIGYYYNLPAGTYYIPVVNLMANGSNPTGAYTMTVLSEDVPPPPVNDNCEDVTPTTLTNGTPVTFTGTTVGASTSSSEATMYSANATMVWEAVTLTGECSTLTISYCGTPAGTNVSRNGFITKSCTATSAERINAQKGAYCDDGKVIVIWYGLPAGTYYIPVVTYLPDSNPGEYTMTVLAEDCPPAPANDNCEDVTPTVLTNGIPVTFTGNNSNARATPEETALFGWPVVWEAVTLTGACNNLTFDFCGTDWMIMNESIMLKGYLTSCSSTSFITGQLDRTTPNCPIAEGSSTTVRFYDLPAGTYYIPVFAAVHDYWVRGEYTMNVLSEDCFVVPPNDSCDNAIPVACGETHTGTTKGASNSGGNPARDVFYTYKGNGAEELVTVSLCNSQYDTFVRIYRDCSLTEQIAFNDDYCGGIVNGQYNKQSQVTFPSDGISNYVIMVEGAASAFGDFEMKVSCETVGVPANDNCENAIALSCGDTKSGSTTFATDSGGTTAPDVFYSYTGNGTPELVTVSLCGSLYNTYLRVFDDCTLTNEIAANITSLSCPGKSELSFVSDGTSTYIIMVEGKAYPPDLSKGPYEISLTCAEAPAPLTCATTLIPSDNVKDAMTLGHVGSFGTQYAVDIPVGDTGYSIEGFVPTVLSASSYFNFIFFEDNGGTPGEELFTRAGTIESSENLGTLFSVPVLKYRVKFDKVVLQPNKTYWVQIDCNSMGWAYTEVEPMRLGYADVAYNWTGDVWESLDSQEQLAFELICSDDLETSEQNSFEFSYAPNPVNDILYISSTRKVKSVSAFNMAGQKVLENLKVINGQVNVNSLPAGNYVFKAVLESGHTETFKIIKK